MISIIIPTFNRQDLIGLAIKSCAAQNFPVKNFEILIVDNGSTDNTKQIVETAITAHPAHQIHYLYEPEPGSLSARHRGALEAKSSILIFIDDDIEVDVNWLQAIEESFVDPSVQIVGGRNLPKYEVEPPKWIDWFWQKHPYGRTCEYLSLLDFGDQVRKIDANYVWSLNFSIRKEALFELGGFHPDYVPKHLQHFQGDGETGLTQKANQLGYKAIYQPRASIFHHIPKNRMTYEYFERRCFFQGVCNSYTDIRESNGKLRQTNLKEKIKAPFRAIKQNLLMLTSKEIEAETLRQRFKKALLKGYQFHQDAVYKNPELINWILKEDYWDYKLPNLNLS